MSKILENKIYFFNNKQIEIINQFPSFNIAIIKYIDSSEEFKVDINFISTKPIIEQYITFKI